MRQKRALVVDDEPDIRDLLSITLGRMESMSTPLATTRPRCASSAARTTTWY
ncbi:MAG: hypothetical protein U1E63_17695 [Burkholderiales bacterium]